LPTASVSAVSSAFRMAPVPESARLFYLLICRECAPLVMPFGSQAERGKWAGEHTRGTGHDRWFVTEADHRLSAQEIAELMTRDAEVFRWFGKII
jgi:hypothetical protein